MGYRNVTGDDYSRIFRGFWSILAQKRLLDFVHYGYHSGAIWLNIHCRHYFHITQIFYGISAKTKGREWYYHWTGDSSDMLWPMSQTYGITMKYPTKWVMMPNKPVVILWGFMDKMGTFKIYKHSPRGLSMAGWNHVLKKHGNCNKTSRTLYRHDTTGIGGVWLNIPRHLVLEIAGVARRTRWHWRRYRVADLFRGIIVRSLVNAVRHFIIGNTILA